MNFRLKTSKSTAERLKFLQNSTGLTPNILARYAVVLSLKEKQPVNPIVRDSAGQEFNRPTLTGKYDIIFKALIAQREGREISDEEYFPGLFNAHLERGAILLENEYRYAGNYQKMIFNLLDRIPEVKRA
jgi:DNA sulfur modification protein DndE